MIRFNANLFRIAFSCASNEEARYYLRGVFVEPHHEKGVTLSATNGHKLISIHDESGSADESAIINLGDALKQCKAKRGFVRQVAIGTGENEATIYEAREHERAAEMEFQRVAIATDVRIDGSFPDYRRVIPRAFNNSMAPAFASQYIAELAETGLDLAAHFLDFTTRGNGNSSDRKDAMQISAEDCDKPEGSPALIVWPLIPQALAILMPARNKGNAASLPAWFSHSPVAPAAQAAE